MSKKVSYVFQKVMTKFKYDVCIVGGFGHIGLPLGIVFAHKGLRVMLYDVNKDTGKLISSGKLPYVEYGASKLLRQNLKNGLLNISYNKTVIKNSKNVVVTIGTPIDEYLNPKANVFLDSIEEIKPYLSKEQLLVIRSSVYPRIIKSLIKSFGKKYEIAYCPERILQGYGITELQELPQLVSGSSRRAIKLATSLFSRLTESVVECSIEEAELIKLFSNSWRYIQFATANQFYKLSNDYGVDYNQVRKKMVQGYKRAEGIPQAGFAAGPCLLKDTMQLSNFSGNNFLLGQAAMNVNEGMPKYILDNIEKDIPIFKKKIGILGMAFKPNVDDIRDSLSYRIKKEILFRGGEALCTDPFVDDKNLLPLDEVLKKSDYLILATPHSAYEKLNTSKKIFTLWDINQ